MKLSQDTFIKIFFVSVTWKWKTVGHLQAFLVYEAEQNTLNQLTAASPFLLAVLDYF